jgi:hypothetical protein
LFVVCLVAIVLCSGYSKMTLWAPVVTSTPTVVSPSHYTIFSGSVYPTTVTVADVDGDGDLDVLTM